jgi:spermidine synthase
LTNDYWDGFLVLPFAGRSTAPGRVAILGNAGGTTARAYGHYFPRTAIDAVEIDGEVSRLGRRWLGMRAPRLRVYTADARPFLRRTASRYDAIFIDAYRQPYIPFYLATREFFELARDRLAPGGAVIVNIGHPERSSRLERTISTTMAAVFGTVLRDPIEPTNSLVLATDTAASARSLGEAAGGLPAELPSLALASAARLGPALDGGDVWTDDRAPVEWLIDRSIVQVAADGG